MTTTSPPTARAIGLAFCLQLAFVSAALPQPGKDGPPPDPEPQAVNAAAGIPLFPEQPDSSLWGMDAGQAAEALRWPEESRTSRTSSFRNYIPTEVFGRKAYSMVLHAESDNPVSLSFVFANKGDIDAMIDLQESATKAQQRQAQNKIQRDYKRFIREDAAALQKSLEELFGKPKTQRLGVSPQTAETVKRWDWRGHSFLLAAPRDEYVTLRVVPTEGLDESGIERVGRTDLRAALSSRVEKRDNGDVVITDIPMVDQGPKGYCVPATWERALRFMGIPADMYILAMAGNTAVGGGTTTKEISDGAKMLVQRYGRRIETKRAKLNPQSVAPFLDKGIPLMWAMFSMEEVNDEINARTQERRAVSDWAEWKNSLRPERIDAKKIKIDREQGHVCMIIGYNRETGEIAVSDSWGPQFAERWMTFEEAEAVSQGEFTAIVP